MKEVRAYKRETYEVYYTIDSEDGGMIEIGSEFVDSEYEATVCPKCRAILTDYPRAYMVYVNSEGEIEPVGSYWLSNKQEFQKIIAKIIMK